MDVNPRILTLWGALREPLADAAHLGGLRTSVACPPVVLASNTEQVSPGKSFASLSQVSGVTYAKDSLAMGRITMKPSQPLSSSPATHKTFLWTQNTYYHGLASDSQHSMVGAALGCVAEEK